MNTGKKNATNESRRKTSLISRQKTTIVVLSSKNQDKILLNFPEIIKN